MKATRVYEERVHVQACVKLVRGEYMDVYVTRGKNMDMYVIDW